MSQKISNPALILKTNAIKASKGLGQNFLKDLNIADKIIKHASLRADDTVLEIGPGLGMLTTRILNEPIQKLICIERDEKCLKHLNETFHDNDRLEVIHEDALLISEENLIEQRAKLIVIANLPYNIGTKLLLKWLRKIMLFERFILMFQREVALRICASPGTKEYGSLSVLVQTMCAPKLLFHVPPNAFFPQPKITSSVVLITPRTDASERLAIYPKLERICAAIFSKRRKTLKNACESLFPDTANQLLALGLDPNCRPENLLVENFVSLALMISSKT